MASQINRCLVCLTAWTGFATCHCSRCHRTFTAPTPFDAHQDKRRRRCIDPTTDDRFMEYRSGVWGGVDPDAHSESLGAGQSD